MYHIHVLLLLVRHLGCNHLSCLLSNKMKWGPTCFFMLVIWGVKVHAALGHSYLLAARLYSTCCDAGSLLAASLHHAGGLFPAPPPRVSLLSVFYSTYYKLRTRFQNVSLLVFETQALRNVAVDLCILKPHGNWQHELLTLFAVKALCWQNSCSF